MNSKDKAVRLLLLAFLPLMAACGDKEARVPVHPVSGVVTYGGKPAAGARVVLYPVGKQNAPSDIVAAGVVKKDGGFNIGVYEAADGAPAGEYVATIEWRKVVVGAGESAGPGPNVLPVDYSSRQLSPVKVTVKEGDNTLPPIRIARR